MPQWSGLNCVILEQRVAYRAVTYLFGRSYIASNGRAPHCRHDNQPSRNYTAHAVPRNYYDLLGIKHDASMVQVKAAYYRLSKEYHPDLNKSEDAQSTFQQILEAYEVLSNKRRRSLYDQGVFVRKPRSPMQQQPSTRSRKDTFQMGQPFRRRPNGPEHGATDIYNFDEFYRMHYGASIHNKQTIRDARDKSDQEFRSLMFSKNILRTTLFLGLLIASISTYRRTRI